VSAYTGIHQKTGDDAHLAVDPGGTNQIHDCPMECGFAATSPRFGPVLSNPSANGTWIGQKSVKSPLREIQEITIHRPYTARPIHELVDVRRGAETDREHGCHFARGARRLGHQRDRPRRRGGSNASVVHNVILDGFNFVPLQSNDLPGLATWLARPHVSRWWREPSDLASVKHNYGPLAEGLDPTEGFIVHFSGRPIGYVQRYLIDEDPDWHRTIRGAVAQASGIGIDYLIGERDLTGRGIGRRMIAQFVSSSWNRYPAAEHIVVALQQENIASWRALAASGFQRVWEGDLESSDPSDRGPSFIYIANRNQD
jgi:aminoglycoside 6'-N-acetyltransferase